MDDVKDAIRNLKPYNGIDDIGSQHLKNATNNFYKLLTLSFNACLWHTYLPQGICNGIMVPLLKGKFKDPSKLDNYRPIIKSSIFLKVLEYLLLPKISRYFKSNDRQHGFKKSSSTNTALLFISYKIRLLVVINMI